MFKFELGQSDMDSKLVGDDLQKRANEAMNVWFKDVIEPRIREDYKTYEFRDLKDFSTFRKHHNDYALFAKGGEIQELSVEFGAGYMREYEYIMGQLSGDIESGEDRYLHPSIKAQAGKILSFIEDTAKESLLYSEWLSANGDLKAALEKDLKELKREIAETILDELLRPRRSTGETAMKLLRERISREASGERLDTIQKAHELSITRAAVYKKMDKAKIAFNDNTEKMLNDLNSGVLASRMQGYALKAQVETLHAEYLEVLAEANYSYDYINELAGECEKFINGVNYAA